MGAGIVWGDKGGGGACVERVLLWGVGWYLARQTWRESICERESKTRPSGQRHEEQNLTRDRRKSVRPRAVLRARERGG
eukprot:1943583-Rhodomonas_salina.1